MSMDGESWGLLIAVAMGVLAFAVARWATRHFAARRAEREAAAAAASDSRQVRRAKARQKR